MEITIKIQILDNKKDDDIAWDIGNLIIKMNNLFSDRTEDEGIIVSVEGDTDETYDLSNYLKQNCIHTIVNGYDEYLDNLPF